MNIFLAGSLWAGLPIMSAITTELILRPSFGRLDWIQDAVFLINPVALAVCAAMGSIDARSGGWQTRLPGNTRLDLFEYTTILVVVCAVGVLIGLGAVLYSCRRFNRLSGRTS
jgi:hypothetical protein